MKSSTLVCKFAEPGKYAAAQSVAPPPEGDVIAACNGARQGRCSLLDANLVSKSRVGADHGGDCQAHELVRCDLDRGSLELRS